MEGINRAGMLILTMVILALAIIGLASLISPPVCDPTWPSLDMHYYSEPGMSCWVFTYGTLMEPICFEPEEE